MFVFVIHLRDVCRTRNKGQAPTETADGKGGPSKARVHELCLQYPGAAKFEEIEGPPWMPYIIKGTWSSTSVNERVPPFNEWLRADELDKTPLGAIVYFAEMSGKMTPLHAALESELLRQNGHPGTVPLHFSQARRWDHSIGHDDG